MSVSGTLDGISGLNANTALPHRTAASDRSLKSLDIVAI
jgi:hypothetical protein